MTRSGDRAARLALGLAALLFLALFLGGALAALVFQAGTALSFANLLGDAYLRRVALFTLEQAALSTLLSLGAGLPLALALHRTRFFGRGMVLRLFLLPQALPVLVGALAILSVWGRAGVVSQAGAALGLPPLDIYGLPGILIAHVFFNMPLAARLMVSALDEVPAESWKLAGQLSLGPVTTFRVVEWPAIRKAIPGAASLVFMLCVTSFTLVLTLGGGPGATTLEVAIYQALRYDFDPARAVAVALIQLVLTGLVLLAMLRFGGREAGGFSLGRAATRHDRPSPLMHGASLAVVALGVLFVLSPLAAVLIDGLKADLARLAMERAVQQAALTSALVAGAAAMLSLALSLFLLLARQSVLSASVGKRGQPNRERRLLATTFELSGSLTMVVPAVVVGAGWFLLLRRITDVFSAAPFIVVATNAVMAMPFIVRILSPALAASAARHDRLAQSIGLYGLARLRHVEWPALRRPLALSLAFAGAFSLGDLGAVALYGNQDFMTLPFLLLQRMGSYRTADAAGLALLLGALCLALMMIAERGVDAASGKDGRP
ncbi:thiamine/thiamine pyrophosphate ABC transporter permease [Consotaella salsifontis]|uniref:Thiamine transport system permease protein ThiP n=1 Tax=Consotaella salsifontis TaxID=1365950 RepID=A0A1T4QT52_9HYPH|nr:thiamine/thiamine pyrophosphate ABC transporter permease [Consotaella salsifontis]SKA06671.1 thiamine transport system permease protein [Consotaella salsifontis]